jgi:uncharacterized Ntn-hydrolase superfamily protein
MTFSIVAIDRKTKTLGIATASGSVGVGNRVPHIKEGIGAIATQGLTEVSYGIKGLELLEMNYTPQKALEKMLKSDSEREKRQVIIIDVHGRKAAFTGKENLEFKGHIIGKNYIVAGNLLASENVIREMAKAFERGKKFEEKLLLALEAGKRAGGDARGERSAALITASKIKGGLNLKVDNHQNPIEELRELFNKREEYLKEGINWMVVKFLLRS